MKLTVDQNRCQGHTMCHMLAPQLFVLSEADGHASAAVDEIPEEFNHLAQMAADSCPEQAITIDKSD
ncbi:ferredoxin [Mycobacterium paraintracellulare]|uniref:ferredoxin n=1 Tax=Mycobacterium paraintracellulare TaxID=1138383 RepID=UPI001926F67B|nr:ferredoxin [Mycobacterium paraintracellulare]